MLIRKEINKKSTRTRLKDIKKYSVTDNYGATTNKKKKKKKKKRNPALNHTRFVISLPINRETHRRT